jgi:hypothetical protein
MATVIFKDPENMIFDETFRHAYFNLHKVIESLQSKGLIPESDCDYKNLEKPSVQSTRSWPPYST